MKQSTKRHRALKNDIRFSTLLFIPLVFFGLMGELPSVNANDIQVSNVSLNKDTGGAYWEVSFDITWQNSWRTDNLNGDGATNWDAAWVFVKYYERTSSTWGHAYLTPDGHSAGSGTVAELAPGKANENGVYDATDNPIVGAMLYRSENGSGTFSVSGVTLRWDYTASGLSTVSDVMTDLFAIEMVHVAPGPFFLGSGGSEDHRFYAGGTDNNPFLVTDDWDGCVADAEGCLWATGSMITSSDYLGGQALTPDYPRGTEGFSIMKYEISQQQYVDFLNTLTPAQASARFTTTSGNRQGIREVSGKYATSTPFVAANRLSWVDGAAYLDWAGLRPMTELEYEKAARGFSGPVANEYAWGTTNLQSTGGSGNYSNLGDATETVSQGNAVYGGSNPGGPARVGIFAGEGSNREAAGAGYWGVMELSGNLWERTVSGGNVEGRAYRGYHGDGMLAEQGFGDVETWPGYGGNGITGSSGSGFRGGNFTSNGGNDLRISDRNNGNTTNTDRNRDYGFRGVRGVPDDGFYELDVVILGEGSVTKVPDLEAYEPGTEVELTVNPGENWFFGGWTGDVEVMYDATITITVEINKTIVAVFSLYGNETEVVDVVNPATGVTWMDRNLGASRSATSSTDTDAYGDLYQWGRDADGHQKRTSGTTSTLSSSDQPSHGDFIVAPNSPYDWRSPQNNNLWQGVNGVNNPCPVGYRLPTYVEWNAERGSWSGNNRDGAYGSPLKLPVAGYRNGGGGSLGNVGSDGYYWSSSVDGTRAGYLVFGGGYAGMGSGRRAYGRSVRCRKDEVSSLVTLMIGIEGNGSVDPVGGTFELGSEVELTAIPDEGWVFSEWTGDVPVDLPDGAATDSVLTLTMDSDKSVTAVFEEEGSSDGWPRDTETAVVDVVNPATGVTWMDRNLGASRAATSPTDSEAYGDLYQWGRAADGHQKRTSSTRSTLSSSDQPGHGDFITTSNDLGDWRSPQNDSLWQGANGTNNPCPVGYRLPTEVEWDAERESWSSNNRAGAYNSPLRLQVAGQRLRDDGSLWLVGTNGYYWSSTVDGTRARRPRFYSTASLMDSVQRVYGSSVRCRKDGVSLQIGIEGNGSVDPVGGTYEPGTTVELTAISDEGWEFLEWTGDVPADLPDGAATDSVLTLTMDSDKSVTAVFEEDGSSGGWPRDTETAVVDVVNPATGVTWMDRNLGASRVATGSTDSEAYGDLYQWGRAADGHEKRNSPTTSTLSSNDQPGHGDFITTSSSPYDWRSPQNDNLWQGAGGLNNPCPVGYRLPTYAEWQAERGSWSSNNSAGAYGSPLKQPVAGLRSFGDGSLFNVGSIGFYWSSTVDGTFARFLFFISSNAIVSSNDRASGYSVRCRKD